MIPSHPNRRRRYLSSRSVTAVIVVLVSCQSAAAKHESLGDEAYARGRFADALIEYRFAFSEDVQPNLVAKRAMAALNSGDLEEAAEQFATLAPLAEHRATEAADGLERVAQAALRANNGEALQAALVGLQNVAEGRAIGRFARELAADLGDEPESEEALDVLLYAAAAAPNVDQQDSLMFVYSTVLRRLGRCAEAVPVLESLVRRGRLTSLVSGSRGWATNCALRLGRQALDRRSPEAAVRWFEKAVTLGSGDFVRRSARIGVADARAAMGDFGGAIDGYRFAQSGLRQSDSLYVAIDRKINNIFDARNSFR